MDGVGLNATEVFVSLQGEGLHVGRRHLFVRLGGCPLRCRWCDTPASLTPVPACRVLGPDGPETHPNPLTVAALDRIVERLIAQAPPLHALAVTGGEPLAQTDALVAWLAGRHRDLPVLLETAGIRPDRLDRVVPWVDMVSLDFKCPSNSGERALWAEHRACLETAVMAGAAVYVKMPVDGGTAADDVVCGARLVAAAAVPVPLFLTPIADPASGALCIDAAALDRLHALASREHTDVRVLPQMHKIVGVP